MPVFDIPKDRLVELTDADLRELVARLCEADRERQGGHRNEVRWGGSQTAADGGLDVVVEPVGQFVATSPLVRRDVGIQVKAADLAAAAIINEMRYGGSLRPAISALGAKGGAYLIASAGANCSEAMLQRRLDAMRSAVADDPNGVALDLGFLDRNAISRWVSEHPSVAAWLRRRLMLPILAGWQPFGRWSSTPEGEVDDLICEEGLLFHIGRHEPIRNIPAALDVTRSLVRNGTGAVRIAGLSGIGKSRIVQALFEPVGDVPALPASHAIYTDLGHSPDPAPMSMLEALIERGGPAILIVDNCPPDTHQALARKLAERPGPVRLISVEYDVRADRPEETDVIRIEAEGSDIVAALLRRRRRDLSSADVQRLAELAQGNARLGFALARAAPQTGTLSTFEDSALFDRLFWQRGERNEELARAAEVLSLVYSFDLDGEGEPDELTFLGSIADLTRGAMHRHAATLLDRGLAQARSRWRAVLPHALANRLARQALTSIPWRTIADGFSDKRRLRRSLARRLSYLHDSSEARRIATGWMAYGGPLHGPAPDMQVLEAVCHLVPNEALQAIDSMIEAIQAAPEDLDHLDSLTRMIYRIAHSEAIFPCACERLVTLTSVVDAKQVSYVENALSELFGLYLSGTLAQTETRIRVARQYLLAHDANQAACGMTMLRSALRTDYWSSSILTFEDARPDAFGWEPYGHEVVEWFSSWLELAVEIALHGPLALSDSARKALSYEIDRIWKLVPTLRPRIDELSRQLHEAEPWAEGWHALKQMLYFIRRNGEELPEADIEDVIRLIDHMQPIGLESRVRAEMAIGWDCWIEDDDEDMGTSDDRQAQRLERIGQELARDHISLHAVGRDLIETESGSFYHLGVGLASGADCPEDVWVVLRDLYLIDPTTARQSRILTGFIQQLDISNAAVADRIRGECRATPALRKEYGVFLVRGILTQQELENVIEIAGEPDTSTWHLADVAWREERALNDEDRVRLLRAILANTGGPEQVINALMMLKHVERGIRDRWPESLREVGLDAIVRVISAGDFNSTKDEHLSRALSACLRGDNGSLAARAMDAIADRAARTYVGTYNIGRTLATLAELAPAVFLPFAFSDEAGRPSLRLQDGRRPGPLSRVPVADLIEWCRQDPARWKRVALSISPFSTGVNDDGEAVPISPLAAALLNAASCPEEVVEAYLEHIFPMSCTGSRANLMELRLASIEALREHPEPEVGRTISRLAPDIRAQIERIRQAENVEEQDRDRRFE